MPFDGSGTFNRNRSWAADEAANVKIRSDYHDTHDGDLANGLSQCITKNGSTQPTADIPMNSHRLINMANPIDQQDAATRNYVDNFRTFSTSVHLTGADLNGMIYFDSPTGANGLSWAEAGADMSFIARKGKLNETANRLVINNHFDPTNPAGDVLVFDENGFINFNSHMMHNLSYEGGQWRTINPGIGELFRMTGGQFGFFSNDTASITNPYSVVALHEFVTVGNSSGSPDVVLNFAGSGKTASLHGRNNNVQRWLLRLGDAAGETGANAGSNFDLHAYGDGGNYLGAAMLITRASRAVTFPGALTGSSTITSSNGYFVGGAANLYLASQANGQIILRPNGPSSAVDQAYIDTNGDWRCSRDIYAGGAAHASYGTYAGAGVRGKQGSNLGYSGHWMNSWWTGVDLKMYANTSFLGDVAWQCDYRIKKDIEPIPSTWEAVKALTPIRYTQKAYDIWIEDDRVRWGFLAHDLQEKLFEGAASGVKDGPDIQSPNLMAIIAGLTKALQEAMARIEALEAAA